MTFYIGQKVILKKPITGLTKAIIVSKNGNFYKLKLESTELFYTDPLNEIVMERYVDTMIPYFDPNSILKELI